MPAYARRRAESAYIPIMTSGGVEGSFASELPHSCSTGPRRAARALVDGRLAAGEQDIQDNNLFAWFCSRLCDVLFFDYEDFQPSKNGRRASEERVRKQIGYMGPICPLPSYPRSLLMTETFTFCSESSGYADFFRGNLGCYYASNCVEEHIFLEPCYLCITSLILYLYTS